ncbi:DNA translocase FtsK [bacterium]|nr:DNA translocase FtsK [bacterium]
MASYQSRQRDPLLDQRVQAMLERRGRELFGLVLIALACGFALMLMSYSANDPGWMVATDQPAHNVLGRVGAAMSSTLMTVGGLGSWGIPVVLGVWGVRFATHQGADRAVSRVVFAVIAVALGSVYCATLVPSAHWPHSFGLGGLFGDTILASLMGIIPGSAAFALKLLSLIVALATLAMFLFVTGFSLRELALIARFLAVGLVFAYSALLTALGKGAQGSVSAAQSIGSRWQERRATNAERAAEDYAARQAAKQAARAAAIGTARMVQAEDEPDEAPRRAPAAQTGFGRPAALRADPHPDSALYAAPKERTGLLARLPALMRRDVEPEPELIEPALSADAQAPTADRIRARISSAIRSRTGEPDLADQALSPITAAIRRREPPVVAERPLPRTRQPLIADTSRPVPLAAAAVAAPLIAQRAASIVQQPGLRLSEPPVTSPRPSLTWQDEDMPIAAQWDEDAEDDADIDETPVLPSPVLPSAAAAPRVPLVADRRPAAPLVQPAIKKAAPSRQAVAEEQPRLKFEEKTSTYELPPLGLLTSPSTIVRNPLSTEALEENARMLESVLDDYGVRGEIVAVRPGPVVTMYELEPAPGLKASRVIGLSDDIARSMSALSARVSTVPGRTVIGIELPNATREKVVLREILSAREFGDSGLRLPLALGKDIGGEPIIANLAKMPHLLIAGTTGSGKSVAINTMILSLLYKLTPEECRLIMIDPKMLELSVYDGIPHLLSPVVTDPKKAVVALKWVVSEMEDRYRKMSKMGVRNIEGYNGRVREALAKNEMFKRTIQTGFDEDTGEPVFETDEFAPVTLPYIVVVVDEMADLMMVAGKEIEACIQRLAQMARASGIHLIMATQRPSVDVITGTIKANFPTRISFQVTSRIDSRTILGEQGAEQLLGMGDMLYMAGGAKITRIHGPFVSDEEVEEIVAHLKSFGPPEYMAGVVEGPEDENAAEIDSLLGLGGDGADDSLYDQAVAIVARDRKCSTSYIQRKLGIGYNKAAKLVEQMEEHSVITAANHVGKREILIEER